ncbi:MAG: arylesterase [Cocleimonas sp.]
MHFKQTIFTLLLLMLSAMNTAMAATNTSQKILVWGDSLSAAYGIPVDKGWVNLMRQKLGEGYKITNASISGETTQGGLTRLPAALKRYQPDIIIIELGANDGLRGIPPTVTKRNLKKMIEKAKQNNIKVLLLGMKIPPNYGIAYSKQFEKVFAELAKNYKLPFVPFFMEDIVGKLNLFQEDELHPTAEAQPFLLKKVMTLLKDVSSA